MQCDFEGCGKKFTTVYNLNSHKKLHERPCVGDLPPRGMRRKICDKTPARLPSKGPLRGEKVQVGRTDAQNSLGKYSTALAYPNATHSARGKGLASKDLLRNKFTPGAG